MTGVPTVAQGVKDLVLWQLWLRSQLWLRFDPWSRNFHMLQVWPEKKKDRQKLSKESASFFIMFPKQQEKQFIELIPDNMHSLWKLMTFFYGCGFHFIWVFITNII